MRMLTHEEMLTRMLNDPAVKASCDAQSDEFALHDSPGKRKQPSIQPRSRLRVV